MTPTLQRLLPAIIVAVSISSMPGQSIFLYDQQSSVNETPPNFGAGGNVQLNPPGQSFTPTLPAIDFVRLKFDDGNLADGLGGTVYVNIHSGSMTGTILGTTGPVSMTPGFAGAANFFFGTPVDLVPGTTYFLEPVQSAGGNWNIEVGPYLYPGGTAYANGVAVTGADLWFREGLIPEPPPLAMLALAGAMLLLRRRRQAACAPPV